MNIRLNGTTIHGVPEWGFSQNLYSHAWVLYYYLKRRVRHWFTRKLPQGTFMLIGGRTTVTGDKVINVALWPRKRFALYRREPGQCWRDYAAWLWGLLVAHYQIEVHTRHP